MRYVLWTDDDGMKYRSMLRDKDKDSMAKSGIFAGPPDIDWASLRVQINNALVDNGLYTWDDINASPVGLLAIVNIVKRAFAEQYKLNARQEKGEVSPK